MKVAVISDIHGNHYALESVLTEARKRKVEKLLILGDIVGYYYHPELVMKMISDWDYRLIRGNHEDLLSGLINKTVNEKELRLKYGSGHNRALQNLSPSELSQLIGAPVQLKVEIGNCKFLMCHGSPWDADKYIYPDAKPETLEKCDNEEVDFVLIGHSHYQFIHNNAHSTLINAGSVGQSRALGGVANWVIIVTDDKSVELMGTPYDTGKLEKEIDMNDPELPYLKNILKRGKIE